MRPVVHGLGSKYCGMIDVLFLHLGRSRNDAAKMRSGVSGTPHIALVDAKGQSGVPMDSRYSRILEQAIRMVLTKYR
jgi:hypothetical protein